MVRFSMVSDHYVLGKVRNEPEEVVRIAIIGVLCSCEDYDEVADVIDRINRR